MNGMQSEEGIVFRDTEGWESGEVLHIDELANLIGEVCNWKLNSWNI